MSDEFIGRRHDFDFQIGRWHVANRRLRQRLVGSNDWEEFPSSCTGWGLLDGGVSIDEFHYPSKGLSACTVRTLDVSARRWSIYWIPAETGILGPPVCGGFHHGRGEFYGDDLEGGQPVRVRFIWTRVSADALTWEQAFATDGGLTWETNWLMDFTRIG